MKSDSKKPESEDSKGTSLNGDSKEVKKNDRPLNGSKSKKSTPKKKAENSSNKDLIEYVLSFTIHSHILVYYKSNLFYSLCLYV